MKLIISIHLLAAVVWVGGMFFSLLVLRPSCMFLEPPLRMQLTMAVMGRFFNWVWILVLTLVATGWSMIMNNFSGIEKPWHVISMLVAGHTMLLIFLFAYLVPFQKARSAIEKEDRPTAGRNLDLIRKLITANLALGIFLVISGSIGRHL